MILLHLACQVVAAELLLPRPLVEGTVVWQQLAASILASLTTLAIAIPWLAVRGQGWLPLRLSSGKPVADIAVGLLMLLAVTPALLIVAGLLNQIVPYHHPILDFLAADRGPRALLLTATSAVLVAPLAEEFFFAACSRAGLSESRPQRRFRSLRPPLAWRMSTMASAGFRSWALAWLRASSPAKPARCWRASRCMPASTRWGSRQRWHSCPQADSRATAGRPTPALSAQSPESGLA